jgi:acyl-homoserine-lactone acylase
MDGSRRFRRIAVPSAIMMLAPLCLLAVSAPPTWAARATGTATHGDGHTAEIRRTEYGIPHVLAGNFGDLGFGYGYAFAQDNVCAMADQILTLRGERSKYFGPAASSPDGFVRGATNLASDTYFQGLRQAGVVQRLVDRPAPLGPTAQVRRLVDGYVAGYNRYLRDTGVAHLPDPTCRNKPWVGPITALDVWTGVNEFDRQSGTAALKSQIVTASPPTTENTTTTVRRPVVPAAPADGIGSNGWALGRDATRAHDGMVLANPHLPWSGNARLYQVQLTIPGVLDVSGAAFYGSPLVQIGHTRGVAWTHTATHAQHASLYRLSLAPGDPTSYLIDGKAVPMTRQRVRVTVGAGSTVTTTLYSSRYGPVLAGGWTTTDAYAIKDANADNVRSMNEWLAMGRAQNLDQLRTAQRAYQGMPWVYTLATDTSGTAYFTDSSVVPHLTDSQAQRCILQADPERVDVLDGSTSACDWGSDADAVEPGVFGPGHAPALARTDSVANSNNSPMFTNPTVPLTGYPGVFDSRTSVELRPRLGLQMIAERRAGADGLGAPGFSLRTLQAVMLGDRVLSAEFGRADVVAMCRAHPVLPASDGAATDVRAACTALAHWDSRDNVGSRGAVLWATFFEHLTEEFPDTWWRIPYDPAHPVTTPRGINADDVNVRHALADAVRLLADQNLPLDATPGSVMRWEGIPLHGGDEQVGCFNVVAASTTSGSQGRPAKGASFVMAVELTSRGPQTRTILTYSESADPASPHHTDQTVLFSRKQWVTERFTDAEINADPHLRTATVHD